MSQKRTSRLKFEETSNFILFYKIKHHQKIKIEIWVRWQYNLLSNVESFESEILSFS